MAYFIVPQQHESRSSPAPSFYHEAEAGIDQGKQLPNLAVIPFEWLRKFHFTFLIRHPALSIPSYYRCTISPKSDRTGVTRYSAADTGYKELRELFDYLRSSGVVGPSIAGRSAAYSSAAEIRSSEQLESVDICIVDASDLLPRPEDTVQQYCPTTGLPYSGLKMLTWDAPEGKTRAREAFSTWEGLHENAIFCGIAESGQGVLKTPFFSFPA
jgi:hypothetical protein